MNTHRKHIFSIVTVLALLFASLSPFVPIASLAEAQTASGTSWYASPSGSSGNSGAIGSPLDIATALSGDNGRIKPGDTVWLRGGTYGSGGSTNFFSTMSGTASSPIYVRQYAGERATVNGSLEVDGNYVWFWGFEIENSNWQRLVSSCGSFGNTVVDGIHFKQGSTGSKMINLVIHDVSNGISDQQEASQTEDYGNLIYNTGWDNTSHDGNTCRGHGHSLYMQNDSSVAKVVENNIAYNSFAENIQGFGSAPAISHLHFVGNTAFNAGMNNERTANMTLGGGSAQHEDILFDTNVVYQALNTPKDNTGYNDMEPSWNGQQGRDLTMRNNFWIGATPSVYGTLYLKNWQTVNFQGNTIVGQLAYAAGTLGTWNGSGNRYFNSHAPAGTNDNSPTYASNPTGLDVVIRPNKYEPGRANITVMNWDKKASVTVNLATAGLTDGTAYEIRDAQNFWGAPVLSGTYRAGNPVVSLPMSGTSATVSKIMGIAAPGLSLPPTPAHTSEEFGAFIIVPKGVVAATPPSGVTPPDPTPKGAPADTYVDVNVDKPAPTPVTPAAPVTYPAPATAYSVLIPAESGTMTSPMQVHIVSDKSYITSTADNSGSATYSFTVPVAGEYVIWARVLGTGGGDDSFFVSMDNGPSDIYDDAENTWSQNWQWTRVNGRGASGIPLTQSPRSFTLSVGSHTLILKGRELGSKMDTLLITNDKNFVATDASAAGIASAPIPVSPPVPTPIPAPIPAPITTQPASGSAIRINAGYYPSTYADANGASWSMDKYSTGGEGGYSSSVGTTDFPLQSTVRMASYGQNFGYHIPAANGTYIVHLWFNELYMSAPGQRVFTVNVNGNSSLQNFDILKETAVRKPIEKTFSATVTNGFLDIGFQTVKTGGSVSAIEILPAN
jgi:hypothetical protein